MLGLDFACLVWFYGSGSPVSFGILLIGELVMLFMFVCFV